MCINSSPIQGYSNLELHLLKEGQIYDVIDVHPETLGYNIGIYLSMDNPHNFPCYWGGERFVECFEESEEENIKEESNEKQK